MCGSAVRTFVCLCFVFAGICNNCFALDSTSNRMEDSNMDAESREAVISLAKEIAAKNEIDVSDCSISINQEGKFTVVKFEPKKRFQFGGGVKMYFEKKAVGYVFVKGVRFQ
jgi:hypothetical protein